MVGIAQFHLKRLFVAASLVAFIVAVWPHEPAHADGATLKLTPSSGTYEVGSLVDISFIVDTGGQTINAVQADVTFPPDKLQVVNPVASTSFISLWVTAPTYSNTDGTLKFQGGIPNPGIKTSGGVISTVTFRVKAAGAATIRYASSSRVLLNDGNGTNVLTSTGTADLTLKTPPPAGPVVTSPTHPDSNTWFNNPDVQFNWAPTPNATGYSFAFDQSPNTVPDDTVDTTATAITQKATSDGVWYFHVRSLTNTWGGVTTYSVQIDATAPAKFEPKFDKGSMTTNDVPTLRFVTTDSASGVDHYELKELSGPSVAGQSTLFIEAASPYVFPKFAVGSYAFVVRAFDKAGNSTDATIRTTIVAAGTGAALTQFAWLHDRNVMTISLIVVAIIALLLIVTLVIRHFRLRVAFEHRLQRLNNEAAKKSQQLNLELDELRRTQSLVNSATPPPTDRQP